MHMAKANRGSSGCELARPVVRLMRTIPHHRAAPHHTTCLCNAFGVQGAVLVAKFAAWIHASSRFLAFTAARSTAHDERQT